MYSSRALIINCTINPRNSLYRYYNYTGGFLHFCFAHSLLHRGPPPVGAAGSSGGRYWTPASRPASLWRESRRDGSLVEVRLEPVYADNLGTASNLEA